MDILLIHIEHNLELLFVVGQVVHTPLVKFNWQLQESSTKSLPTHESEVSHHAHVGAGQKNFVEKLEQGEPAIENC